MLKITIFDFTIKMSSTCNRSNFKIDELCAWFVLLVVWCAGFGRCVIYMHGLFGVAVLKLSLRQLEKKIHIIIYICTLKNLEYDNRIVL